MFVECEQRLKPIAPPIHIDNPLIERLNMFVTLGAEERDAVAALTRSRRSIKANETLVREGSSPDRVFLILSGAAFRYRFLENGRRQIIGYLLPGDLCDTKFLIDNDADHSVGALCDIEVATIVPALLMATMVEYPKIERALLMMSLVDAAIMREWLINVGQRDAFQKLAHFFCEMNARYRALQSADTDEIYSMPLTQVDLADTMGLTVVHVNRVLQRFRREGLLSWSRRHVEIPDPSMLESIAGFNDRYLRLPRVPAQSMGAMFC